MSDAFKGALEVALKKIAQEMKYDNYKLEMKAVSSGGANYSSRLYSGTISAPDKAELKWFGKVAVISEQFRENIPAKVYEIEQFAYKRLLPFFESIETKYDIPQDHRLAVPAMFGYLDVAPKEVIVLEDLSTQGFSTHDRLKSYDWHYASAAVKQLAEFHALSLSSKHTYPQDYENFEDVLSSGISSTIDSIRGTIRAGIERSIALVKEENRERVVKYLGDLKVATEKLYKCSLRRPVIVHGDFRMSNILHKVDENEEIKLYIVDYQTLYVGSVASDLLYFIATGSNGRFRGKHYQPLLDSYYEELCRALKRLQLDPEQVFPREDFDLEIKDNLPSLLVYALYTLPVVTVDAMDAPDLNEQLDMESIVNVKSSPLCVERLNEFVDDFIMWGLM